MPHLIIPRTATVGELDGSNRDIDGWSIATLVVFLLVNILVILPLRIPLPFFVSGACQRLLVLLGLKHRPALESTKTPPSPPSPALADAAESPAQSNERVDEPAVITEKVQAKLGHPPPRRWHFTIGLNTAPVIGVLLLLATTCIPGSVVRTGIVGSSHGVRPYDVMTLFICFAYISVSLDSTGLLRYLAFLVASRASSSGRLLFNVFYAFWTVVGLIVGNDPLILSGTPFLSYFTSHANIKPPGTEAFLYPHFQVANLVSALLVSSNPTNLVLTSAFGVSFLSYSAWMALPTVTAVVFMYPLLRYFLFRASIPQSISPPKVDARAALKDPWGGIFGAGLFLITIVLLVGLSAGGKLEGVQGVWTVTAPAALIMLGRDILHDVRTTSKQRASAKPRRSVKETEKPVEGRTTPDDSERATPVGGSPPEHGAQVQAAGDQAEEPKRIGHGEPSSEVDTRPENGHQPDTEDSDAPPDRPISPISGTSTPIGPPAPPGPPLLRPLTSRLPIVCGTISRLPFPLLPFAFSMFILVEALQHTGWIRVFGKWWGAWADVGGVAGSVFLMGVISVIGCNIFGTNIGATIMLSRVLQQWESTDGPVSDRKLYGAVFALAVGSNFGAYSFVFSASLAGLLWRSILGQKGITIRQLEFIRYNWLPLIVTMIVGLLVVGGEVCVMYKT